MEGHKQLKLEAMLFTLRHSQALDWKETATQLRDIMEGKEVDAKKSEAVGRFGLLERLYRAGVAVTCEDWRDHFEGEMITIKLKEE